MSPNYLSIGHLERRLALGGDIEELRFEPGVNVLVGRPNTGKTKWLETLDYLLGDLGENPFDRTEEEGLTEKYDLARAELLIGEERMLIERRWREPGAKTKIFVDGEGMKAQEFQHFLLEKLGIPLLNFPRGNPMSGQTWPELSFRMLLRHIYRQQRFWNDIADQQPETEQHACLLQFLGLAEKIFTEDYGQLINRKIEVEQLKARRDQYGLTLNELAREALSEPGLSVDANVQTVRDARERLERELEELRQRRVALLSEARDKVIAPKDSGRVSKLGEERASIVTALEEWKRRVKEIKDRLSKMNDYREELQDELDRLTRAKDAGAVLADLRITHCPACDQTVSNNYPDTESCFLCHQPLLQEPIVGELGAVRLRFENDRISGELKEADQLISVLQRDSKRVSEDISTGEERLRMLENELAPARQAVAAFVQQDISAIDMALGQLSEKQRQLERISAAVQLGQEQTKRISAVEREIEPLQAKVDEAARATDFEAAAAQLEEGMNAYLTAINTLRPKIWRHSAVRIDLTRASFSIKVGARRWNVVLGGTDTLYLLMAYHYSLLTIAEKIQCHYPGLAIIDVPAEFSGEAIEDKENFIVQPFIDLVDKQEYTGAQLIITGASFSGLEGANRLNLTHVYAA